MSGKIPTPEDVVVIADTAVMPTDVARLISQYAETESLCTLFDRFYNETEGDPNQKFEQACYSLASHRDYSTGKLRQFFISDDQLSKLDNPDLPNRAEFDISEWDKTYKSKSEEFDLEKVQNFMIYDEQKNLIIFLNEYWDNARLPAGIETVYVYFLHYPEADLIIPERFLARSPTIKYVRFNGLATKTIVLNYNCLFNCPILQMVHLKEFGNIILGRKVFAYCPKLTRVIVDKSMIPKMIKYIRDLKNLINANIKLTGGKPKKKSKKKSKKNLKKKSKKKSSIKLIK